MAFKANEALSKIEAGVSFAFLIPDQIGSKAYI